MDIRNFNSNITIKTVYSSFYVEMAGFFPLFIVLQSVLGAEIRERIHKNKKKKEEKVKTVTP